MPTRLKRYDEPGHVHFWTISCYHRLSFFWSKRGHDFNVYRFKKLREKLGYRHRNPIARGGRRRGGRAEPDQHLRGEIRGKLGGN